MIKSFILREKIKITHDVFEMIFEVEEEFSYLYGQFITFILPAIGGRAYSMLDVIDSNKIRLIIKRLENGRGGSKFICDSEIGTILKGVGPAGHFVLRENNKKQIIYLNLNLICSTL